MTNVDPSFEVPPENIDLRRYFFLLWQWVWAIALVAIVVGAVTYYMNWRITPVYQATTQLLVSDPPRSGVNSDTVVTGYYAANTYAEMHTDSPVLEQVATELNINKTARALKGAITVRVITNTQVLSVTVENTNPQEAADIANKLGTVFTQRIKDLQGARYLVSKDNLQVQIKDMETQIDQTNADRAAATDTAERDRLDTKLTQYRTIYSNLVTSYENVRLAEAQNQTTVVQVEPADVPLSPVRPQPARNGLLGALVGALLAAGVVVAIDALDDTMKDPAELSRRLGLPILGMIPFTETEKTGPVTKVEPRSPVSESYRSLRTNVMFANAARKLRRIVVTSPTPQDGKTTISTNLAIILAQGGQKVTLVDADMRRPRVHAVFGLDNKQGLSALFLKQVAMEEAILSTGIPNLGIIPSGAVPPNPAELLSSIRMEELLYEIQTTSETVIIDTPPVLSVTDSSVLIPYIDGILLVVQVGQTHNSAITQAVDNLRQVGANIVGLVVNGIKFSGSRYSYYYRSRYYSNYYHYSYSYSLDGKKKGSKRSSKEKTTDKPAV